MFVGSSPTGVSETSDFDPARSNEFLDVQENIECGFTMKHVSDMIIK